MKVRQSAKASGLSISRSLRISILLVLFILLLPTELVYAEVTSEDIESLQSQLNEVGNNVRELQDQYSSVREWLESLQSEYDLLSDKVDLSNQLHAGYIDSFAKESQRIFGILEDLSAGIESTRRSMDAGVKSVNKTLSANSIEINDNLALLNEKMDSLIALNQNDISNEELLKGLTEELKASTESIQITNNLLGYLVAGIVFMMIFATGAIFWTLLQHTVFRRI